MPRFWAPAPMAQAFLCCVLLGSASIARGSVPPDSLDVIPAPIPNQAAPPGPFFAIVAFDSSTIAWGVACAAGEIACGARVPFAAAGAGAVAILGRDSAGAAAAVLGALAKHASADSALRILQGVAVDPEARQAAVVGFDGAVAAYSGSRLPGYGGARVGRAFACVGHGLRGAAVLEAMAAAYLARTGDLGTKLLGALEAGEAADGESLEDRKGDASAALLIVRAGAEPEVGSDRLVDLRVDQAADPLGDLGRLYQRHADRFLPAARVRFGDAAKRGGDEAGAAREYAAAEAGFRSAVARAPKDADALNELAWFLATRGRDPSEAMRFAEAAVLARPDDPNLLDTLAEAAYRAGNLERAIEAEDRAAKQAKGNTRYAERLRAFQSARTALTGGRGPAAPSKETTPAR